MQSPLQAFACIVSANILFGKASHRVEPRFKEWGRFPMVGKYYKAKSSGERVGARRGKLGYLYNLLC